MSSQKIELTGKYIKTLFKVGGRWVDLLGTEAKELAIDFTTNREARQNLNKLAQLGILPTASQLSYLQQTDPVIQDFRRSVVEQNPTQSGVVLAARVIAGLEKHLIIETKLKKLETMLLSDTKELIQLAPAILKALIS